MAEGHWRIQFPNWSEEKVFGEVFVDHGTLTIERQVSPTLYELVRAFAPGGWLSAERISEDNRKMTPPCPETTIGLEPQRKLAEIPQEGSHPGFTQSELNRMPLGLSPMREKTPSDQILEVLKQFPEAEAAMDEVERARGDAPHRAVPLAERIRAQFAPFTEKARP
jgi:hypothetical protein